MLRGSTDILNTVCSHLGGIKPGATTKDGKFTVVEVECQGACSNAPMLVVGDDFYVRLFSLLVLWWMWVLMIVVYVIYRRILQMRQPRRCWMRSRRVKSPSRALRVVVIRVRTRPVSQRSQRRYVPPQTHKRQQSYRSHVAVWPGRILPA